MRGRVADGSRHRHQPFSGRNRSGLTLAKSLAVGRTSVSIIHRVVIASGWLLVNLRRLCLNPGVVSTPYCDGIGRTIGLSSARLVLENGESLIWCL